MIERPDGGERDRDDDARSRSPRTATVPPEGVFPAEFVGGPENMPGSQEPPPEVAAAERRLDHDQDYSSE